MFTRTVILLFISFITGVAAAQNAAKDSNMAPPGRMVDIGGRKLHILSTGKGSPTIVLVAGGGAFAVDWGLVQARLDSTTRICSYDQAGLGWSDPGPLDETVEQTVSDLHMLLKAAGERGPYILVGASIGGIYIQAYQHTYPKEVAGLVFCNSSNRIAMATKEKTEYIWDLTEEEIRSIYPLPTPAKKRVMPTKVIDPFDKLPTNLQAMRLYLTIRLFEKWDTLKAGPESTLSWRKEFLREFSASDTGKVFPLGKLPVVVVSSNPRAGDSMRYSRDGAASRLDFLSSNCIHITAEGSGHEIHLYQPDKVVEALKREVESIRKRKPLEKVAL